MHAEDSKPIPLKQRIVSEFKEWLWIVAYLAFFFCVFSTYKMVILNQFHVSYFTYGAGLLNAVVLSKVILIGEHFHVAKGFERRALVISSVYKALVFSVLVAAVHLLEEGIRNALHGHPLGTILREMAAEGWAVQFARAAMVFCVFIPFFGFMEIRRALGKERFWQLIRQPGNSYSRF
jgi:hypothetical protein